MVRLFGGCTIGVCVLRTIRDYAVVRVFVCMCVCLCVCVYVCVCVLRAFDLGNRLRNGPKTFDDRKIDGFG